MLLHAGQKKFYILRNTSKDLPSKSKKRQNGMASNFLCFKHYYVFFSHFIYEQFYKHINVKKIPRNSVNIQALYLKFKKENGKHEGKKKTKKKYEGTD